MLEEDLKKEDEMEALNEENQDGIEKKRISKMRKVIERVRDYKLLYLV